MMTLQALFQREGLKSKTNICQLVYANDFKAMFILILDIYTYHFNVTDTTKWSFFQYKGIINTLKALF